LQYTSGLRDENDSPSEYSCELYDSYKYYEESDPDADDDAVAEADHDTDADAETVVTNIKKEKNHEEESERPAVVTDHSEFQTDASLPVNNEN
jgi:predicted  nucleic acid-binding Zn-ribbon protein